jgi:hypothetical protein
MNENNNEAFITYFFGVFMNWGCLHDYVSIAYYYRHTKCKKNVT